MSTEVTEERAATLIDRVQAPLIRTRGVGRMLMTAGLGCTAEILRQVATRVDPAAPPPGDDESFHSARLPRTVEEMRALIAYMRRAIAGLHDVKDYGTVRAIDDEIYVLWKELEHKMQTHRQSEARLHLQGMFRI